MKMFALVLFDLDGYTSVIERRHLITDKESTVSTTLNVKYGRKELFGEILCLNDDKYAIDVFQEKWEKTERAKFLSKEIQKREKLGTSHTGGFLALWPRDETEIDSNVQRVENHVPEDVVEGTEAMEVTEEVSQNEFVMEMDWQSGKSLKERMKLMLEKQLMCDVIFLVGENAEIICAHTYMLASASSVFYTMFEGSLAEKGKVTITDIAPASFKLMLKFIYTDDVEINYDNVEVLLLAGDKYCIQVLKDKCVCFLKKKMNTDYVFTVLKIAFGINMEELKSCALEYILRNGHNCLKSVSFVKLPGEYVKHIIKSDTLRCKEEHVYEQMVRWAKFRCTKQQIPTAYNNVRACLGDLLYLIRFPTMKQHYFTENVSNSGLLTSDETINVFRSFTNNGNSIFISQKRHYRVRFRRCVCNYDKVNFYKRTSKYDCVDFQTSFNGKLCAVLLFGSTTYSGSNDVTISILLGDSLISTTKRELKSEANKQIYEINLSRTVDIHKMKRYTVKVNMKGPSTLVGKRKSYKHLVYSSCGFTAETVTFLPPSLKPYFRRSEICGQIPGLTFSF
ncbi:BTB/POZ domain-containing protein 6-B-like [Mytilus edulis]|uniref:BTB/POZ domain-containing protein 6-B-like n=1 Tax=Mytilus edulis TaxID=6550 RepID=UPI0039F019DA